jgi:adenine deaminase
MEQFSKDMLDAARGLIPADAVFKNASVFNPFTCDWEQGTLAVKNGLVLGIGSYTGKTEFDVNGSYIIPGFIDAHVHIESSLLVPREYARLVVRHGTTSVIADPHEIANVSGTAGIDFMLAERQGAVIDIQYMLPSCVPATPLSRGGAVLDSRHLLPYVGREGIIGLGEMMNVLGALAADSGIGEKLRLCSLRDGHAPQLFGKDLNAYILAGLQSDHECTGLAEAEEKLRRGMYLFIREGSTECNISDLIGLVTPSTVSRCSFASDDSHADTLFKKGHIDHCIRRAIECGLEPELAYRMATLSPAERFGLFDRGALTPGRRADFCIIDDPRTCRVKKVFVKGKEVLPDLLQVNKVDHHGPFSCPVPEPEAIRISGTGEARVIGLIPHQIITKSLRYTLGAHEIPDFAKDILKIVVCNRYGNNACGVGLVHGFSLKRGAIASSVSHDAHNIIAVGTSDAEIRKAIEAVILSGGAMVAVLGDSVSTLPLSCGGLMSTLPYPEVVERLGNLHTITAKMCSIDNPFMYLSFLALQVIPSLRITDQGMFDVLENTNVPLFTG